MNLLIVLVLFLIVGFNANAMEEKEREVKTITDISWFCAQLAKKVSEQPLFDERGLYGCCKVLLLESYDDANICSILTKNTQEVLKSKGPWILNAFGCGKNQLYDDKKCLGPGIKLTLYSETPCSVGILSKKYKKVIRLLQHGWQPALLEEYPTIMHKEDPKHWNLFVKRKNLKEQDTLISLLADKFEMSSEITCMSEWLKTPKPGYEYRDEIYLWVKKDAQEKFDGIFGFKYQ